MKKNNIKIIHGFIINTVQKNNAWYADYGFRPYAIVNIWWVLGTKIVRKYVPIDNINCMIIIQICQLFFAESSITK